MQKINLIISHIRPFLALLAFSHACLVSAEIRFLPLFKKFEVNIRLSLRIKKNFDSKETFLSLLCIPSQNMEKLGFLYQLYLHSAQTKNSFINSVEVDLHFLSLVKVSVTVQLYCIGQVQYFPSFCLHTSLLIQFQYLFQLVSLLLCYECHAAL